MVSVVPRDMAKPKPVLKRLQVMVTMCNALPQRFGRCDHTTGIVPFDALVDLVMAQKPYQSAKRVFLIIDNGSSHRGQKSVQRLQSRYKNLVVVHLPVHASWLNQVEICFSVVQRKVLTPNDFTSLATVAQRLYEFESYYEEIADPFEWKFTRQDLKQLLAKLDPH